MREQLTYSTIITNHSPDKIEVISKFDFKKNVLRIEVQEQSKETEK